MRITARIILAPILACLMAAAGCNSSKAPDDQQIVTEIQSQLFGNPKLKTREISVVSSEGVVTVSGQVASNEERLQVGEIVRQAEGVRQVTDMLDVVEPEMEEPEVAPDPEPPAPRRRSPAAARKPAPPKEVVRRAPAPAPTPAPVRTAIVPTRLPAPKPVTVEVPAGVLVSVRLIDTIDSKRHQPGEEFAASLASPLNVDNHVLARQGADATVRLVDARTSGRIKGRSELIVELVALTIQGRKYSVRTESYVHQGASRGKSTAKKVGGGAALGSIIGALAGGKKGAAIGGAVGAGAGTAAQAATQGKQARLESETRLDFTLEVSLTVTLKAGR